MQYNSRTEQNYRHLKQRVEDAYPAPSQERACYKAVLNSGLDLHRQMAIFSLLVSTDAQEAGELLATVKQAYADTAGREIIKALNDFPPACRGKFYDVFKDKGYLFLDRTQKWHEPRREFQPDFRNNPNDKNKLAAALVDLPKENSDIFMAAYHDFVIGRGTTARAAGMTYLSYNELCYVGGLLLQPGEARDRLLGREARNLPLSTHHARLVAANNFVSSYCREKNQTVPYTDFDRYFGGQSISRQTPTAFKENRKKSPGLATISFIKPAEAAPQSEENKILRGKGGFNLLAAQAHLETLIEKKQIRPRDRDLFNKLARQDGPDVNDVADQAKQTPLAIVREYMSVVRALQPLLPKDERAPIVTANQKFDW